MKIEAGKFYTTRDGRKAYVATDSNPFCASDPSPCIGWVDGEEYVFSNCNEGWTTTGRYHDESRQSEFDLVSEWVTDNVSVKRSNG
jgi:hypothetical protein